MQKGIEALAPSAVVMIGIAFGVNPEKQAIGDVLVSTQLWLYDLQRVGKDEIIPRGDKPHASARLVNYLRNAHPHWKGARVRFGLVMSGDELVDNVDRRDQLRRFEPEVLGGEMEGAGLYVACQDAKVDWILVKGICDWADGNKGGPDKDAHQALAAGNAARFVVHALQLAALQPPDAQALGAGTGPTPTARPDATPPAAPIELSAHFTAKDDRSPIDVRLFRPDAGTWTESTPSPRPSATRSWPTCAGTWRSSPPGPPAPTTSAPGRSRPACPPGGAPCARPSSPPRMPWPLEAIPGLHPTRASCLTIDALDPRVLRLPWELLADQGGHLFTHGISVRRRLQKATDAPVRSFDLPVRILLVVSRPEDPGFFDPRSDARPLLDALDGGAGGQAEVEFLYPPTLAALDRRLQRRADPPVHVVHLTATACTTPTRPRLPALRGRGPEAGPGQRRAPGHPADKSGIPMMILSACQSGKPEEATPTRPSRPASSSRASARCWR